MQLFSSFPKIVYNGQLITNITIRLDFIQRIKNNLSIFQYVQIQHAQRPEDIAEIYYNDPTLYWIVLFMNDIVDPYYDWLLTDDQLWTFVNAKYSDPYSIHHYISTSNNVLGAGIIVDSITSDKTAVTNLAYEQAQNELKRKVKILKQEYIAQVLSEYQNELKR